MNLFYLIIALTLLIGPLAFWLLTRNKNKSFPSSPVGAIGDILLLPLFNGFAIQYGLVDKIREIDILMPTIIITVISALYYLKNRTRRKDDWSVEKNHFSGAGWYHYVYYIIQSFIIIAAVLSLYNFYILWIPLGGYLILASINKIKR